MKEHPSFESLSAYFDGETPSAEKIRAHLDACGRCRGVLASLEAERRAIRAAWTAPEIPEELNRSLLRVASAPPPWWKSLRSALRGGLRLPAALAAAAACLALVLWGRGAGWFGPRVVIPSELFVAAHNQYELTLPLAPTEKILTEMPRGLALGVDVLGERNDHVY